MKNILIIILAIALAGMIAYELTADYTMSDEQAKIYCNPNYHPGDDVRLGA